MMNRQASLVAFCSLISFCSLSAFAQSTTIISSSTAALAQDQPAGDYSSPPNRPIPIPIHGDFGATFATLSGSTFAFYPSINFNIGWGIQNLNPANSGRSTSQYPVFLMPGQAVQYSGLVLDKTVTGAVPAGVGVQNWIADATISAEALDESRTATVSNTGSSDLNTRQVRIHDNTIVSLRINNYLMRICMDCNKQFLSF